MSELLREFEGHTFAEWAAWCRAKFPHAVEEACRLVREKLKQFKDALEDINDEMIRSWVKDLLLAKTFVGLRYQEGILKKVAEAVGLPYRWATPSEEARGVHGVVGETEVSIKPRSWRDQVIQREKLAGVVITYEKGDEGIAIEFEPEAFLQVH